MKIYIGNLPEGGQIKEDVRRLFSRYGETWDCVIIKTYGFIHMEEESGNKAIKQLDGYNMEGKRMRVEKSMRTVGRRSSVESKLGERRLKEKSMRSSSRETNRGERRRNEGKATETQSNKLFVSNIADETTSEHKLFVSNIAVETTSEQLKEAFETCCYVIEVDKRRGKNFGFVHIRASSSEIRKIILKMNLFKLNGKRISVHNSSRLEVFNPVSEGNFSKPGGLVHADCGNNCNNMLDPFMSARDNGVNEFGDLNCNRLDGAGGDLNCNRLAGAGGDLYCNRLAGAAGDLNCNRLDGAAGDLNCNRLAGAGGDHSFKRRMDGCNMFRDRGSCNDLGGLSKTVGDHNCNKLGGCNIANDGRFNMKAGLCCNTIGEHSCNKPGGFNIVGGNSLDGFGGTVGDVVYGWGGCAGAVNEHNGDRLSAFRNTVDDNSSEKMGEIVVKKDKADFLSDTSNQGNGDVDIKMKIAQLNKTIKTEERKSLINERLVNDLRNQVNYLERKIKHLETEKTESQLRSQVQYLQKRVKDLQDEKKVYRNQQLYDHDGRYLPIYPTNQRSSKANKRVMLSAPESSSSKRGCFIESQQKQSTKTKNGNEAGDMSDDDIQIIDVTDYKEDIKIVDEKEEEDVKILSESKLKEDILFRNRRDDNVSYISENESNEVEIMLENGTNRRKNLTKYGSKNRMLSDKFDEEGGWGVVKSERCKDGDIPLICLEDEEVDVKEISEDDYEMQNMSDGLGEVFNELDDETVFQGVPPLDQVLGVPPPQRDVRKTSNVIKKKK